MRCKYIRWAIKMGKDKKLEKSCKIGYRLLTCISSKIRPFLLFTFTKKNTKLASNKIFYSIKYSSFIYLLILIGPKKFSKCVAVQSLIRFTSCLNLFRKLSVSTVLLPILSIFILTDNGSLFAYLLGQYFQSGSVDSLGPDASLSLFRFFYSYLIFR
jgi:hypothetical protein